MDVHLRRNVSVVIFSFVLMMLATSCKSPTYTYTVIETTGNLSVEHQAHVNDTWSYPISGTTQAFHTAIGDELVHRAPGSPRPTTATFTVEQAGLTTLTMKVWEREEGSGLRAESWVRKQAFFALAAPIGTEIELPFSGDTDPEQVTLKIDYDANGIVDQEMAPTVYAEGDDLMGGQPMVIAVVEETSDARATITLVPDAKSPEPAAIYYSIYPSHPELQLYSQPVVIDEPSLILYGAVGETGSRQLTREVEVMGGIADDLQLTAGIDGEPTDIVIDAPGQRATVVFDGEAGQQVEIRIEPTSGGIQPCCQATATIMDPHGEVILTTPELGDDGWTESIDLRVGGEYTVIIDPLLANTISTSIILTPTS